VKKYVKVFRVSWKRNKQSLRVWEKSKEAQYNCENIKKKSQKKQIASESRKRN